MILALSWSQEHRGDGLRENVAELTLDPTFAGQAVECHSGSDHADSEAFQEQR